MIFVLIFVENYMLNDATHDIPVLLAKEANYSAFKKGIRRPKVFKFIGNLKSFFCYSTCNKNQIRIVLHTIFHKY